MAEDEYVETIIEVAERDVTIAAVLREICALPAAVRLGALELVGAQLRTQAAARDASRAAWSPSCSAAAIAAFLKRRR